MLTDAQRRGLYAALEDKLGSEPATNLMSEIARIDWSDVARRSDIGNLRTELHGEIIELRTELKGEIADLRHEFVDFRAEMRAELKGLVARQLVASVPLAFGVAGLVLAAVKLA